MHVCTVSTNLSLALLQATVLIETLPAAFEMDEILFELREHSAGLNCGRWDYIFSFIKTLRADPKAVMPDRCLPLLLPVHNVAVLHTLPYAHEWKPCPP